MNWNTSKALGGGRVVAVLGLTGILLTATGGACGGRTTPPPRDLWVPGPCR